MSKLHELKENTYYAHVEEGEETGTLLYVMGFLMDEAAVERVICNISMFVPHRLSYESSIQGPPRFANPDAAPDEWKEITREEYVQKRFKEEKEVAPLTEAAEKYCEPM